MSQLQQQPEFIRRVEEFMKQAATILKENSTGATLGAAAGAWLGSALALKGVTIVCLGVVGGSLTFVILCAATGVLLGAGGEALIAKYLAERCRERYRHLIKQVEAAEGMADPQERQRRFQELQQLSRGVDEDKEEFDRMMERLRSTLPDTDAGAIPQPLPGAVDGITDQEPEQEGGGGGGHVVLRLKDPGPLVDEQEEEAASEGGSSRSEEEEWVQVPEV